jgi:hypothetical protein
MEFSRVTSSKKDWNFQGQPVAKKTGILRGNQQKKGWNSLG